MLEHKSSNMSETHKARKKLLWRAYRNSRTLFQTVPPATFYGLLFPKIRDSQLPPKTSIAIISGMGKATDFKFRRYILRTYPNKSPLKISEKRERARIDGLLKVFKLPNIISGTVKLYGLQIWPVHSQGPSEQKPIKILEKAERGCIQGLPKCFKYPYPLLS